MKHWKADEMEMTINYTAARNAFAFITVALAVTFLYEFITTGELGLSFLILAVSNAIFWGTKTWLNHSMSQSED